MCVTPKRVRWKDRGEEKIWIGAPDRQYSCWLRVFFSFVAPVCCSGPKLCRTVAPGMNNPLLVIA